MASVSAVDCATRATDESLSGPDWVLNFELCDIVNTDQSFEHRQVKDVMELLKKRLGCRTPTIQHLVLDVLDTLSKNCGENVLLQIIKCDILHEMVIIMKKKPDLSVKEKILTLIETWKDVFAEFSGKYPKFYAAFKEIQSAGVEYPFHAKTDVLPYTQTCSIVQRENLTYKNTSIEVPIQYDISGLSFTDVKKARGIAHMLMEMLNALDPYNSEDVKQEVITELVDQCHLYQKRVSFLVRNTRIEELLCQGLTLNEELQHVLQKHDDIVKGKSTSGVQMETLAPLVLLNQEDDESEDDSLQLCRNSRYLARQRLPSSISKTKKVQNTSVIPSKTSNSAAGNVYYRSGDFDRVGSSSDAYNNNTPPPPATSHSSRSSLTQKSAFQNHSANTENSESPLERYSKYPYGSQSTAILSPSSLKYSQKQQFSKQRQRPVLETRSASHGESRWKSEKQNPLQSNSNGHDSLSWDDRLQQIHGEPTDDKFQNQTVRLDKAGSPPEKPLQYPIHQDASSSTRNASKSDSGQPSLSVSSARHSLSVSSARYSEQIVKPQKTIIHKSKTSSSRQQPEYHSDSEDIPPKSVSSGKNSIFKEFVNYAKKSKKSIASKSGINRTKR